ncbi:MAG: aldehyde ferredoxin oxidoreductase, partial [Candidatus Lokiarchaeota archaeon]|nr:aldehyde ferredoxin oxidoreductase [Candidatus Lokiarchaeota archaeon]
MTHNARITRVCLDTKQISADDVKPEDAERFIGGAGVGAAIFTRETPPRTDAYDPVNLIVISVGPFTGTAVPFNGRHFMVSMSPLTGMMGESSSGGHFGKELKCAGHDHLVISGKSDEPVYIWIDDGKVEFKDASHLWGKGTRETEGTIKKELGDERVKVASIGPAGEHLVRYAAVISEEDRACGRTGMGAIWGS